MESIAKYISEERDVLYLRGKDKARQEEQTKFVSNLLSKLELTIEQIADIAGVSVDFVKDIKQKFTPEK
jgi:predicted transposase YdaD